MPGGKRHRWKFCKNEQVVDIDVPGSLTLDTIPLLLEAAISGLGIAYVPEPYVRDALEDGCLVTVLEDWSPHTPGISLYFTGNRYIAASLRAFIDTIQDLRNALEDQPPSIPLIKST